MQSGMEKDDNYSATTVTIEAEANRDNGSRSFQIQDNLDYSSMCHSKPSSSYDDDAMKVAAANIDGHNHNDIHDGSGGVIMVDYMHNDASLNNMIIPSYQQLPNTEPNNGNMIAVERTLSFADVMQFAEFGAKLALNHNHIIHLPQQHQLQDQEVSSHALNSTSYGSGIDSVSFLKFPVLTNQLFMSSGRDSPNIIQNNNDNNSNGGTAIALKEMRGVEFDYNPEQEEGGDAEYIYAQSTTGTNNVTSHLYNNPVQLEFLGHATTNTSDENFIDNINGDKTITERGEQGGVAADGKSSSSKRKRPRTIKTSEEVESQRMTHIAVERNRRKQMNEHLRVLRSLMPSSYVQRGDQASIIGGAIEFVRELEQLLQCLESQKRRRLYGDQQSRPMGDSTSTLALAQQPPLSFPTCPPPLLTNLEVAPNNNNHHHHDEENDDQLRHMGNHHDHHGVDNSSTAVGGGLLIQEETAESKSSIADVEVKVVGFDALIKILSRRRPGQLIKAIAALEDLQFTILHTNITTIEQTVLYSFNVKVGNEARFTAEDIASSVQQIFTFIHGNTNLI